MSDSQQKIYPDSLPKLDSVRSRIAEKGYNLTLTDKSIAKASEMGFRGDNLDLALVSTDILIQEQPTTLCGLLYQVVSAGWLPSTDGKHYARLGRLMTRLRESGFVLFRWIVDNVRSTDKPSSWSGISDFAETVKQAYRLDFWERLPEYVHIICEKDAIAGTLAPVTREYDVALSPLRGYSSLSFAHEIASTWSEIEKPIHAYYLGDFDPSGFDLERDIREKLERYCDQPFSWSRLAVNQSDFEDYKLLPLAVKQTDKRAKQFVREHGTECAELDAIPSTELRRRITEAIESHIPQDEWDRLKEVEEVQRESFNAFLEKLGQ